MITLILLSNTGSGTDHVSPSVKNTEKQNELHLNKTLSFKYYSQFSEIWKY